MNEWDDDEDGPVDVAPDNPASAFLQYSVFDDSCPTPVISALPPSKVLYGASGSGAKAGAIDGSSAKEASLYGSGAMAPKWRQRLAPLMALAPKLAPKLAPSMALAPKWRHGAKVVLKRVCCPRPPRLPSALRLPCGAPTRRSGTHVRLIIKSVRSNELS